MMLCRCDVCGKEVSSFMQLVVSRNNLGGAAYASPKTEHFDLCSTKCEAEAVGKMLARLVPEAKAKSFTCITCGLPIDQHTGVCFPKEAP
jgi:hypothetical protein